MLDDWTEENGMRQKRKWQEFKLARGWMEYSTQGIGSVEISLEPSHETKDISISFEPSLTKMSFQNINKIVYTYSLFSLHSVNRHSHY